MQKLLNQFAPNLVEGWGMGQSSTHQILDQIWIIYYKVRFIFSSKSGVCAHFDCIFILVYLVCVETQLKD